jgi:prophage regulatory protein
MPDRDGRVYKPRPSLPDGENQMKQTKDDVTPQSHFNRHDVPVDVDPIAHQLDKALRILRMRQLIERTNLSRSTLYVLMSEDPTFPQKIKLTARVIGFLESEVDTWIRIRAQSRDAA